MGLTIQSIRRQNAGYCVDEDVVNSHPFQPGKIYELRLRVTTPTNNELDYVFISQSLDVITNALPINGDCIIENMNQLLPLQPFNLLCNNWVNATVLEYNALMENVLINANDLLMIHQCFQV